MNFASVVMTTVMMTLVKTVIFIVAVVFSPCRSYKTATQRRSALALGLSALCFYGLMLTPINHIEAAVVNSGAAVINDGATAVNKSATPADTTNRVITPEELLAQATFLFVTRPEETVQRMQRLGQSPTLYALFNDPANQRVLDQGTPAQIAQLSDFQKTRQDPDMQALFGREYLSDIQMATLISTYWKRNKLLLDDPQVQSLLNDPELQALLNSGNLLAILSHPKGRQLINAYLYPADGEKEANLNNSDAGTDASQKDFAGGDIFQQVNGSGTRH